MKIKHLLIVPLLAVTLSGCQTMTNQQTGALMGGATGAILGSTIGGGTGRLISTGVGAVIGTAAGSSIGASMDRPTVIYQAGPSNSAPVSNACSRYSHNPAARASCEQGLADRRAQQQQQLEQEAYRHGNGRRY